MLTYDFLRSADGPTEATTRRRLLHVPATVAATAPLAALTAGGAARAAPETTATAPRRIWRAVVAPGSAATRPPTGIQRLCVNWPVSASRQSWCRCCPRRPRSASMKRWRPIAKAVGDNSQEITQTILIEHSVGSQALLAYLSRHGAHRTFAGLVSVAGWFTVVGEHGPQFRVDRLGGRTDHRAPVGQ